MTSAWPTVRLGDVLRTMSRPEPVNPERTYRMLGAHWYAEGLYIKEVKPGSAIQARTVYRVRRGDFVYNRLFAWKGSFAVATEANDGCYTSNEFLAYRCDPERLDARYLWRYFSLPSVWEEALGLSSGSTPTSRNRLKGEQFLAMTIPLPPIAEQRRIVARIEALAAKIEEARQLSCAAYQEVHGLREAVVASVIPPSGATREMPIGDIAEVRAGIQKTPRRTAGFNPVRYLTVAHVGRDRISLSDPRYFEVAPEELESRKLRAGDVLIIEGNGSEDQIGRTALFRGEIEPCVHQNHVIRIRPTRDVIASEFLNVYLNSVVGQRAVQAQSRTSSGLRSLSVGRIRKIQVPVPPLATQLQAVAASRRVTSLADAIGRLQSVRVREISRLFERVVDTSLGA